jgi:hypothetical protein
MAQIARGRIYIGARDSPCSFQAERAIVFGQTSTVAVECLR